MAANGSILSIEKISKQFGDLKAVSDFSWELEEGYVYGLLGQNGAGKTTTLRMILAIYFPDDGGIRLFGESLTESHQCHFGYLPEERGLYRKMRVEELLVFFGKIRGLTAADARKRAEYWLERLELGGRAKDRIEELSRGMQQKIQFIISIIHSPRILILDEPFQGLDPVNADVFKDIVLELKKDGTTVILSTHIMEQAEKLCDRICLIHEGVNRLEGSLSSIRQSWGKNTVSFLYEGNGDFFRSLDEAAGYNDFGGRIELQLKPGTDPSSLLAKAAANVRVTGFEIKSPSLHEIFIQCVSGDLREGTPGS